MVKSDFKIVDKRGNRTKEKDKSTEPTVDPQDPYKSIPGLENTSPVKCEKCSSEVFTSIYRFRKISALLSPTGQEQIMQIPFFVCTHCMTPLEMKGPPNVQ